MNDQIKFLINNGIASLVELSRSHRIVANTGYRLFVDDTPCYWFYVTPGSSSITLRPDAEGIIVNPESITFGLIDIDHRPVFYNRVPLQTGSIEEINSILSGISNVHTEATYVSPDSNLKSVSLYIYIKEGDESYTHRIDKFKLNEKKRKVNFEMQQIQSQINELMEKLNQLGRLMPTYNNDVFDALRGECTR